VWLVIFPVEKVQEHLVEIGRSRPRHLDEKRGEFSLIKYEALPWNRRERNVLVPISITRFLFAAKAF